MHSSHVGGLALALLAAAAAAAATALSLLGMTQCLSTCITTGISYRSDSGEEQFALSHT